MSYDIEPPRSESSPQSPHEPLASDHSPGGFTAQLASLRRGRRLVVGLVAAAALVGIVTGILVAGGSGHQSALQKQIEKALGPHKRSQAAKQRAAVAADVRKAQQSAQTSVGFVGDYYQAHGNYNGATSPTKLPLGGDKLETVIDGRVFCVQSTYGGATAHAWGPSPTGSLGDNGILDGPGACPSGEAATVAARTAETYIAELLISDVADYDVGAATNQTPDLRKVPQSALVDPSVSRQEEVRYSARLIATSARRGCLEVRVGRGLAHAGLAFNSADELSSRPAQGGL